MAGNGKTRFFNGKIHLHSFLFFSLSCSCWGDCIKWYKIIQPTSASSIAIEGGGTRIPEKRTKKNYYTPYDPCMVYLPTCAIKINQMQVNIPVPWILWVLKWAASDMREKSWKITSSIPSPTTNSERPRFRQEFFGIQNKNSNELVGKTNSSPQKNSPIMFMLIPGSSKYIKV